MNDAQIKAKLKAAVAGKFCIERGLYFRVSNEGTGFWILRYTAANKKRREYSFARYGKPPEGIGLASARDEAARLRVAIKNGGDPVAEKHRRDSDQYKTVNDVAMDWLSECERRLSNPQIPERVYSKDIAPILGDLSLSNVTANDILILIRKVNSSGRPTVANDVLSYCKQIFNHALKLDLITSNPAAAFTSKDAGGEEKARERHLSIDEIKTLFKVLRNQADVFTRENYILVGLLMVLGVRKGELIAAKWSEFDFETLTWTLPGSRTKTRKNILIPIPCSLVPLFEELRVRAVNSDYVFPSRRKSQRRPYISDDTLNHALAKLFGKKVDSKKRPYPNYLGDAGLEHFVVHDLRRTCRSLLASNAVPPHIAERCLNHKIKGVEGIYDRYDYLDERREALEEISNLVVPIMK